MRHLLIIVLLFCVILAVPFIMDQMKSMKRETAPQTAHEEAKQPVQQPTPPQPKPETPEQKQPGPYDRPADEHMLGDFVTVEGGANLSDSFSPISFDGSGGHDTYMVKGAGQGSLDGEHIKGFEVFKLQNNKPNTITILLAGLRTAEGSVEIDGDPGVDLVKLDETMKWDGPTEMGHMDLYAGEDSKKQPFTVAVTPGVKVVMPDPAAQKQQSVTSNAPMSRGNDNVIVPGGDSVDFNAASGTYDGRGGKDTLTIAGAGTAALEGIHIRSFEFFKLANKQPNVLYVFHGGLLTLESGDLFIDGDADIDAVRLDPAVQWYPPSKVGSYMRHSGNDVEGRHFTVNVSAGVKVE